MNISNRTYKASGFLFLAYILTGYVCYMVLASSFQFPEILRASNEVRFDLFIRNQSTIVPTYYLWTVTGMMQIAMAVLVYSLNSKKTALDNLAVVVGTLCGVFQIVGFIRWVVLIPMLSSLYQSGEVSSELVFFAEKLANGYLGMTLGEHMGSLMLALWTVLISLRFTTAQYIDHTLGKVGVLVGIQFLAVAFESLGGPFTALAVFTLPGWFLLYSWMLLVSIALIRKQDYTQAKPLSKLAWLGGGAFFVINLVPAML